jgi:hypothetical protein
MAGKISAQSFAVFRHPGQLARLLQRFRRTGAQRSGAANRKVETMKTKIAQATTFAFSAVGALAILVGAIDYPATAAGLPVVGLVGAASTPAVSPMA